MDTPSIMDRPPALTSGPIYHGRGADFKGPNLEIGPL